MAAPIDKIDMVQRRERFLYGGREGMGWGREWIEGVQAEARRPSLLE